MIHIAASPAAPEKRELSIYKPLLAFFTVALLLALTGYYAFQRIEELIEEDKLYDLGAVADMKTAQIVAWRNTHKRVKETFMRDSVLASEFEQWLREGAPASGNLYQRLKTVLGNLQHVNGYEAICFLDTDGRVRVSSEGGAGLGEEEVRQALSAMQKQEMVFFDFHRDGPADNRIRIDLIAPLTVVTKNAARVVGAVVLQIDTSQFLFPLLQAWPTPSRSAETVLVRRDGSDVLYINELRHKKDTALNLRMPLDTPKLPAAMAVRGEASTTDGVDYRGVPVVAEMRPIPGTPWFVVSKVDREELFAPVEHLRKWSTALGIIYVAIGGLLVLFWLRSQKAEYKYLQVQRDAAVERAMLVKHFEYLTRYANDIIIVADETGKIVEANERALEMYGYTQAELLQMRILDLRDPAEDPAVFRGQVRRCIEAGELRYETNARRKGGTTFPVEVSARLIRVDGARYLQGIVRDVSERKQAEQALRHSENLLKESQQMAHIGSWELDLLNNVLYWSDENYRIFGSAPGQFGASYEAFLSIVHPDDRALVDKAYTDSLKNKTPYIIDHRLQFPDGRIKHVREWCETYYDETGKPLRSIGTTQDITQQHLAEEALRKSAEEIEDLYNSAPCGYHSLDENGVFIRINDTELKWLGYAREELIGKVRVADLLSADSQKIFQKVYPEFKKKGFIHDVEYEFVRKDGSLLPVSLSSTAIFGAGGNYVTSRTTMFDITARKLAEKKLSESEKRFRSMADNAPIMIWMAEAQGQQDGSGCHYFNQRWYEFTGLPFEQAPSTSWQSIIHADDKKHCLDIYREAFAERQPFKVEYRMRCSDGVFRWIKDSGVPRFAADGEYLGFIGTCIDITEQKLFGVLRAEMEHIDRLNIAGEMASGLAHELSQPLAAANTYLEAGLRRMAESDWDRASLHQTIRLAHLQTIRAGSIINHLKEIVRKQKFERTSLDINSVIKDSLRFLDYELQHHLISATLDLPALPSVLGNKIEIEQVLINLIKNAIDSMESAAQRELRISTRVLDSGGAILVTVSDTGAGIAPEDIERIFDPFQTSKQEGLGLGLAICRSLVENYGGLIWAEQKEDGEGANFNFTLKVGINDE